MSDKAKATITSCILVVIVVGTLNNLYKKNSLPGLRFYLGNGILYFLLTMFGTAEEELTKNIAIAIAVFAVLGEGGGVIDHFMGKGAANTTLDTTPKSGEEVSLERGGGTSGAPATSVQGSYEVASPTVSAMPGMFPAKPVIPNSTVVVPI